MYLCYIDESGTPEVPGTTTHFVLAGIAIPIWHWHDADREVINILRKYGLEHEELHTAWILRKYLEQSRIPNFDDLNWQLRRSAVERERSRYLLQLQKSQRHATYQQAKKTFRLTRPYTHLTFEERQSVVREVADCIARWGFARLFAECIDKLHFDPVRTGRSIEEQAFEQVVSRFEQYVTRRSPGGFNQQHYGLLIHDRNETVATKHTRLMRNFLQQGTLWTTVRHTIETPLFVDSSLTRMVQMADVCSWGLRRFCENAETDIFKRIFVRADRVGAKTVGVRHFAGLQCSCEICTTH